MKSITLDIETKSDKDLTKCGVYAYAESEYFDILLLAYSVDGGDVKIIDTACGEKIPADILAALTDETIIKQAFNVNFERICLSAYIRKHYPEYFKSYGNADDAVCNYLNPRSWQCTMIHSRYLGLPSSLAQVGEVLKIKDEKMAEGKALIRYFCVPFTETEGVPQFHKPEESPEKWKLFKTYNKRDVEAEMEIDRKLEKFPVPDFVWEEFYTDQMINDRGIAVDMQLAMSAIKIDETVSDKLSKEMCRITGVENPNSVYQLLDWLEKQGYQSDSLGKKEVQELIKTAEEPVRSVLAMRLQLSKSSVKKYQAMEQAVCRDSRVRGMFSFYGASRTGRHCSKIIQLQNLPQNHLPDLSEARELVKSGDAEMVSLLYDDIPDTLSQLIRTAFIPRPGMKFIVADFSAIEARVIAWLAGEQWRIDAFANGEDIYCASASKMFGVPVVKHGENRHLRQKGKVAELACIAEGQLVLTDHGLIPIEKVSVSDRVWDGIQWIRHEGVIYKGQQSVITYDGLTATPDHFVWIKGRITPVPFGVAAATGSSLVNTGNDRIALHYSWKDHIFSGNDESDKEHILIKGKSRVYDLKNAGPNHRFTVSGKLVHNCGYGGSVGAMKAMGADSLGLSDAELKSIVDDWRASSPCITDLWWAVDRAAKKTVKEKTTTETHGLTFSYESGFLFIELPSGRRLAYAKPRIGENRFGGESVTYMGINPQKKWDRLESYGPKFVENCIAKGTLVITNQGYVPIEEITTDMKIWDGVGFVSHNGLIAHGMKETVNVNGIHMTPEHKILTEKGWMECGKAYGFNWADVSLPDSFREGIKQQARKNTLVVSMHMRKDNNCGFERFKRQEVSGKIVWLYEIFLNKCRKKNTWHESPSGLGCMAFNETALYGSESSRIPQLWRKRNNGLSALARQLREFLGGYGRNLAKRSGDRQNRQQQRIQSRKLSLDNQKEKFEKQEKQSNCKYAAGRNDCSRAVRKNRDRCDNTLLSNSTWLERRIIVGKTGCKEYVYDIRNCGPRHRFAVWNGNRAYIVSNCVQGIARDLLMYSMQTLSHCFIVGHVHDEMIIECPKDVTVEQISDAMAKTPPWAEGLLLRAEGYECEYYKKD